MLSMKVLEAENTVLELWFQADTLLWHPTSKLVKLRLREVDCKIKETQRGRVHKGLGPSNNILIN